MNVHLYPCGCTDWDWHYHHAMHPRRRLIVRKQGASRKWWALKDTTGGYRVKLSASGRAKQSEAVYDMTEYANQHAGQWVLWRYGQVRVMGTRKEAAE